MRWIARLLLFIVVSGCWFDPGPRTTKPKDEFTFASRVRVLFSAGLPERSGGLDAAPGTAALQMQPGCASPRLRVQLYDIVALLISPGAAPLLGECETDADGAYTCEKVDMSNVNYVVVAVVDDVDNAQADCVAPTWQPYLACSPLDLKDPDNANCGGTDWIRDRQITEEEAGPAYVVPRTTVTAWNASLPVDPAVGTIDETGIVLMMFVDAARKPMAQVRPYIDNGCREGTYQCRSAIVEDETHLDATAVLTSSAGTFVAQVTKHDETGKRVPVPLNSNADSDTPYTYSGLDCGARTVCYRADPFKPYGAGEIKNTNGGVVVLTIQSPNGESPCPWPDALASKGVMSSLLMCP